MAENTERLKGLDGAFYNVTLREGESIEQAQERLNSSFSSGQPSGASSRESSGFPDIPSDYALQKVGDEPYGADQGYLYQAPDGTMGYFDPSYSTTDQDEVIKIYNGISPSSMYKERQYEDIVQMNPVTVRAQTASRGIPFAGEFIDEAAGQFVSPSRQADIRLGRKAMEETRPIESMGLEIGTGMLVGGPALGATRTTAKTGGGLIARRLLQGTAAGTVEGGLSGYGAGETPEERARMAKFGAGFGGVLGGAGGSVGGFLEAGLSRKFAAVDVYDLAQELNIDIDAARILKDQALSASSPEDIRRNMARMGADARVIDASPNASRLLDITRTKMGDAVETANRGMIDLSRARGRQFRQSLTNIFDPFTDVDDAQDIITRINRQTAPQREDAYTAVYNTLIDYNTRQGKNIQKVLDSIPENVKREAIEKANITLAAGDDVAPPIAFRTFVNDAGEEVFELLPNQTPIHLDYLKRALGDMAFDPKYRGTQTARDMLSFAGKLKRSMQEAIPRYREALRLGLDTIQERESIDIAQNFLSKDVTVGTISRFLGSTKDKKQREILQESLRKMLGFEMERSMARIRGTIADPLASEESIRAAMKSVREYATAENLQKMRLIIGSERLAEYRQTLERLAQQVSREGDMALNSKTAFRNQAIGQIEEITESGVGRAARDLRPIDAVQEFGKSYLGQLGEETVDSTPRILNQVAEILIQEGGEDANRIVETIMRIKANESVTDAEARRLASYISAYLPVGIYQTGETIGTREQ
jgi:hypothetical protein